MPVTLPGAPEQITPGWLTAALAAEHPGARAKSVEIVGANRGTTGRAMLRVAWAPGVDLPERVFVKLPPSDATQRRMIDATDMGRREARFFLCNSVPTELRRAEERDLLARYRAGLQAVGAAVPPFDETWRDYRRLALTSWVAATTTAAAGSRMQPLEVGMRAMARTSAAAADLELLPLLRKELAVG